MKQLILLSGIIIMLHGLSIAQTPTEYTLNGYTRSEAHAGVNYCLTTKDIRPEDTQIWLSLPILKLIQSKLHHDLTAPNSEHHPDGFRIYFSRVVPQANYPIHLNNKIIITSTYYSGDANLTTNPTRIHTDYFETAVIASIPKFDGLVTHFKDSTKGVLLYNKCNCDNNATCSIIKSHDISRGLAEKMVQHFHRRFLRSGKINSTAEWFDIGMLDTMVHVMDSAKCDGLRLYFARGVEKDETKKYCKFVLVFTKELILSQTDTIHKDSFFCQQVLSNNMMHHKTPVTDEDLRYIASYENKNHLSNVEIKKIKAALDAGGGLDNGELCPNHCDGVLLP